MCCLLVLDSVTSTSQWIRQPKACVVGSVCRLLPYPTRATLRDLGDCDDDDDVPAQLTAPTLWGTRTGRRLHRCVALGLPNSLLQLVGIRLPPDVLLS